MNHTLLPIHKYDNQYHMFQIWKEVGRSTGKLHYSALDYRLGERWCRKITHHELPSLRNTSLTSVTIERSLIIL